ncbi:hypothetical protein C8R43DRAFT_353298 [Mycena crocata]|nr:hypothetical protein C8R43DRAFT_353298 [Mycena crocata]
MCYSSSFLPSSFRFVRVASLLSVFSPRRGVAPSMHMARPASALRNRSVVPPSYGAPLRSSPQPWRSASMRCRDRTGSKYARVTGPFLVQPWLFRNATRSSIEWNQRIHRSKPDQNAQIGTYSIGHGNGDANWSAYGWLITYPPSAALGALLPTQVRTALSARVASKLYILMVSTEVLFLRSRGG